jgi:formylmethanofuran dehydrogenase subunit E
MTEKYDMKEMAEWFHGHYKPYIAVGMRMGNLALKLLEANRHELRIVAETGTKPTMSCILDGIQLATGSTIGNGRIEVLDNGAPKATFSSENKRLKITAKEFEYDLDYIENSKVEDLFLWSFEEAED